jgi:hypothetical protein
MGASYYTNLPNGQLVSAFSPNLLIKNDQTLIRLDTFMAVKIFYESIVSDTSNVNSVDGANYSHALTRYEKEWEKALSEMKYHVKSIKEINEETFTEIGRLYKSHSN